MMVPAWGTPWMKPQNLIIVLLLILLGILVINLHNSPMIGKTFITFTGSPSTQSTDDKTLQKLDESLEYTLYCHFYLQNQSCPENYPKVPVLKSEEVSSCPNYFRWIHEDLKPWKVTGITREMLEAGKDKAHFRLVILSGKVYVEFYRRSFETRDTFTIWGIVQRLRKYPGMLPDVEILFNCGDVPLISAESYKRGTVPPPLFSYCTDKNSLDIVFPDWSFWGWEEANIKPWNILAKDFAKGNHQVEWIDRQPYAFWKGNPTVASIRGTLMGCNASTDQDWNARLFNLNWFEERKVGFQSTDLSSQCTYRYKIYIEGYGWSVSRKYIHACDSLSLVVNPKFFDFFSRGMQPLRHFWPISENTMCRSIKFAVDWANKHPDKAQEMGKSGSSFILEDMKMDYIYDFVFHLLHDYAKLQAFKPTIPEGAKEMCSDTMACSSVGIEREFFAQSLVTRPSSLLPCTMPSAYKPHELEAFKKETKNNIRLVEDWENAESNP